MIIRLIKWIEKNILWVSIVALLIPVGVYLLRFGRAGISGDPENWAQFGDYIGGTYSVLITILAIYLARNLSLKDEVASKRREAIDDIFRQIAKIEQCTEVNAKTQAINKLIRLIHLHQLHVSDNLCDDVERLADYYLERIGGTSVENQEFEEGIKNKLKKAYYGT